MVRYKNKSGNSNITAFQRGPNFIVVRFGNKMDYTYTHESAGEEHINAMKELALSGQGLSGYISRNVRNDYAFKEPVNQSTQEEE